MMSTQKFLQSVCTAALFVILLLLSPATVQAQAAAAAPVQSPQRPVLQQGQTISVSRTQWNQVPDEAKKQLKARYVINIIEDGAPNEDGDEVEEEEEKEEFDGKGDSLTTEKDTERKTKMEERLAKLNTIKFSRLPSTILETLAEKEKPEETEAEKEKRLKKEAEKAKELAEEGKKPPVKPDYSDLPPMPRHSFIYTDYRFEKVKKQLAEDFTLGNWAGIKDVLQKLPAKHAKAVYANILKSVSGANAVELPGNQGAGTDLDRRSYQKQFLTFDDIFEIAKLSPKKIDKTSLSSLSTAFQQVVSAGAAGEDLVDMFREEIKKEEPTFTKRQIAKMLMIANKPETANEFLPERVKAEADEDHEALNLLSRCYLARHRKDRKRADLEEAWNVTQSILRSTGVDATERKQAMARAVKLSGQVREELGQSWMNESFVDHPERGMEVLAAIGVDTSRSMIMLRNQPTQRLERLKLQNEAVTALLKAAGDKAAQWHPQLELLSNNWLREAVLSNALDRSTRYGPSMRRDSYGNIYYNDSEDYDRNYYGYQISPIEKTKLLEMVPSEDWMKAVHTTIKPKYDMVKAQLYLKVKKEELALPYIENVGKAQPKMADDLVKEFLRVWTANHNPNNNQRYSSYYMYMYGYESKAESIPLTRSKQQRNLQELAELIPKLEALTEEDLDQELLSEAFFTCHSVAEVYKIDQIENIFGPLKDVDPEIVANIAQRMRTNLAGMWRDAAQQKKSKTKRTKKDLEQEILLGYATAQAVVDECVRENEDDWALKLVNASLKHDENNYRGDLVNSSQFLGRRKTAMKMFKDSADTYIKKLEELEEKDFTTRPFDIWFYASLGSCDLGLIDESKTSMSNQWSIIRETIEKIPGKEVAEWHMDRFSNLLFNRMSSVKPQLKKKYLDAGFEIVGDNKRAEEARRVHDYYKDLVSEIKLKMEIDGDDRVGQRAFGVFVNLHHTKEIEREAGGFGKYLQNQNSGGYYYYNYGRPTEDYRDKFEEQAREVLSEQFDVLSVTFQTPNVKSVPTMEDGWRMTPYAYILLEPRGPEVDKVQPLALNLDFLDTSGYAVLPIESEALSVDCSDAEVKPRPSRNLSVTQLLDERQAADGILIVEVKATANGLVPELDEIMDLEFEGFDISDIEDDGVKVSKFDEEQTGNVVLSERNWMVSLKGKEGLSEKPKSFSFAVPKLETKESVYQKYVDADLESVEPENLSLEEEYGEVSYAWVWIAIPIVLGLLALSIITNLVLSGSGSEEETKHIEVSDDPTPFQAISVLQNIQRNNGLSAEKKQELEGAINRLEEYYFGSEGNGNAPNLGEEVKKWTRRAKV